MTRSPCSEDEYRAFFADVYDHALRFAARRSTSAELAEDAVAEALLVAWRRFAEAPRAADERRAWLFGIVRNTLLNGQRSEARRHALTVKVLESATPPAERDHAERVAHRMDLARAWRRLLPEHQEALALSVFEELSASQAARVLSITPVAYRARLSRARRALHAHLSDPRTVPRAPRPQEATS